MGDANNFKKLMAEAEVEVGPPSRKIKDNLDYTTGFASFSGNVAETFFSTIFGVFISMSGGNSDHSCFRKNGKVDMKSHRSSPDQGSDKPKGQP